MGTHIYFNYWITFSLVIAYNTLHSESHNNGCHGILYYLHKLYPMQQQIFWNSLIKSCNSSEYYLLSLVTCLPRSHPQPRPAAAAVGRWPPVSGKSTIPIDADIFIQTGDGDETFDPSSHPPLWPAFLCRPLTPGCIEFQPKGYDLLPFTATFWTSDTPQSKSETVCPLGINDLPYPCLAKVCEYVDPAQPFISASFYYTASSLQPRQHVTVRGMGGRRERWSVRVCECLLWGVSECTRGWKKKKPKREGKIAVRQREREIGM